MQKRIAAAKQNQQADWRYEIARRLASQGDKDAARTEMTRLYEEAPFYGDPDEIAANLGIARSAIYEQADEEHSAYKRYQEHTKKVEQQLQQALRDDVPADIVSLPEKARKAPVMYAGDESAVAGRDPLTSRTAGARIYLPSGEERRKLKQNRPNSLVG